jgi:hypothetical protein
MHASHDARVQLTANLLNNLATAFAVAGFIAPAASGQLESAGRLLVALVWSSFAASVHLRARTVLGGLR